MILSRIADVVLEQDESLMLTDLEAGDQTTLTLLSLRDGDDALPRRTAVQVAALLLVSACPLAGTPLLAPAVTRSLLDKALRAVGADALHQLAELLLSRVCPNDAWAVTAASDGAALVHQCAVSVHQSAGARLSLCLAWTLADRLRPSAVTARHADGLGVLLSAIELLAPGALLDMFADQTACHCGRKRAVATAAERGPLRLAAAALRNEAPDEPAPRDVVLSDVWLSGAVFVRRQVACSLAG